MKGKLSPNLPQCLWSLVSSPPSKFTGTSIHLTIENRSLLCACTKYWMVRRVARIRTGPWGKQKRCGGWEWLTQAAADQRAGLRELWALSWVWSRSQVTRHLASLSVAFCKQNCNQVYQTPQPFYGLFPGPPGWAGARRELLDFMVQWKINRGRHTDHPAGRHSIWTKHCLPPPSPIFYRPDALPVTQPTVHWRQLVHSD